MRSILPIVILIGLGLPNSTAAQHQLLVTCTVDGDLFELSDGTTSRQVGIERLEEYLVEELSRNQQLDEGAKAWIAATVKMARRHAAHHVEQSAAKQQRAGKGRPKPGKISGTRQGPNQLRVEVRRAYHAVEVPAGAADLK